MKKSILPIVVCGLFAFMVLVLEAQPAFAQRGGGHGGGGGFHGGMGHSGFGSGGGFHGGYHGGFSGRGGNYGYGYGGRGGYYGGRGWYGGRGGYWGHGRYGYGWGWGLGIDLGFGWGPYWGWGYPYRYGYPGWAVAYDPYYDDGYYGGYPPPDDCSRPCRCSRNGDDEDYRHTPAKPSQNPGGSLSPSSGENTASFSAEPDYRHEADPAPTSNMLLISSSPNQMPLRREVQNAIQLLRAMPPEAQKRQIQSGRYDNFSPAEREMLLRTVQASAKKDVPRDALLVQ